MYKVSDTKKVSEILQEVSEVDDDILYFRHNGITATALVALRDKGKKPIIRLIPKASELYGTFINSYVNVSNVDYHGNMEIQIYIGSTNTKERERLCKCRKLPTLGNLLDVFDKCPKLKYKAKYTLVFSKKAKKLDMNKVNELFPSDRFEILME